MPNISFAQGKSQSRDVLISFRQIPGPNERALVRAAGGVIKYSYRLVPGIAASVPQAAIDGLSHNPNVTMIEDDLTVYAVDAELDSCWGVKRIGAGTVHDSGITGAGVKVAIIDSGIYHTHPDLSTNYAGGYDFVNGDSDPMDDLGHGTHCAGIVAAEDNGTGAVGVAPEAELYGLKVLNASGNGSYGNVIAALNWCVFGPDGAPDTGDEPGIQVTSNSYGSSGDPGSMVELAFNRAEAAGIINVCAAGNSGNSAGTGNNMIYPARFGSCIAVAATTSSDVRAYFSSTGEEMELAAPGYFIRSTYLNNGYAYMSGTSMACPHVSGVVALMIEAGVANIRATLAATAEDLGTPGWDPQYGYGLVNAVAAVGGATEPPISNEPPVADDQTVETNEDTSKAIQLTASDQDGDTLTYHIISGPFHGNLSGVAPDVSYTPNANYNGPDSFTFKVNDGSLDSATATVSINVLAVNDSPVAYNQSVETNQDVAVSIELTASDPENDSLTYYIASGPSHGSLTGSAPDVTYTPSVGYSGFDSFTFNVYDGVDPSNDATVNINVNETAMPGTMHVDSITVTTVNEGKGQKRGYAAVVIVDNSGNPVQGATVTGSFKDDIKEESVEALYDTDLNGMTEFFTDGTAKGRCHITFCVDIVSYNNVDYSGNDIQICGSNY